MNRPTLVIAACVCIAAFCLGGCASQQKINTKKCPPLANRQQAYEAMKNYAAKCTPLRATGLCTFRYIDENNRAAQMSFPVRLWLVDKNKYCIYGDVMFDPQAIAFIVDGGRFTAAAKPLSVFACGPTDAVINYNGAGLFFNPAIIADFLEAVQTQDDVVSMATVAGGSSKVLCRSKFGKNKSVYLSGCDGNIKGIDYISRRKGESVYAVYDDYRSVEAKSGFDFPHNITFKNCPKDKCGYSMNLKLNSVKQWQFSAEQVTALFTVPDANGFENQYRY